MELDMHMCRVYMYTWSAEEWAQKYLTIQYACTKMCFFTLYIYILTVVICMVYLKPIFQLAVHTLCNCCERVAYLYSHQCLY